MKLIRTITATILTLSLATSAFAATTATDNAATAPQTVTSSDSSSHHHRKVEIQGTVNINTATAEQLQSLKGIGERRAAAIVQYRTEHGNFATVDDLAKVHGISPKLIAKVKDHLSVN